MTDLGCLYLALGFTVGISVAAVVVARAAEDVARWRASKNEALCRYLGRSARAVAKELAAAYRHRTEVSGGFIVPPQPEPPPPDPRSAKGVEFIERLGLSPEETDDLVGGYEMLAGVRAGTPEQMKSYLMRLRRLGVPLPA